MIRQESDAAEMSGSILPGTTEALMSCEDKSVSIYRPNQSLYPQIVAI